MLKLIRIFNNTDWRIRHGGHRGNTEDTKDFSLTKSKTLLRDTIPLIKDLFETKRAFHCIQNRHPDSNRDTSAYQHISTSALTKLLAFPTQRM